MLKVAERIKIRRASAGDFEDAMTLYQELVGNIPLPKGDAAEERWSAILAHAGTTVIAAELDSRMVAFATLHIMPNMTFGGRPYALIENVVTLQANQGKGVGSLIMKASIEEAWVHDAYKIMLLTGKKFGVKAFYEKLGFTGDEKHGMTLRRAPSRRPD